MGYYDVIYNAKDGIIILLRQFSPARAEKLGSPDPTDVFLRPSVEQSRPTGSEEGQGFRDASLNDGEKSL